MNLRFVEAFHWAAVLKSVTRAAEKLHITQSALSSRIASLENELGVQLLDRRDKRLRLTIAGQRFAQHALKLLDLQRQVKHELGAAQIGNHVLRLGVIESVVHTWLVEWLERMRATHPDFELELTVETTPVLVDQLQRGRLDLVFAALPASGDGVRSLALPSMPMCFVQRADVNSRRSAAGDVSSVRSKRAVPLATVAASDLLTFQRGSQPHLALLHLLRQHGIATPRVHAISSISAMTQLVEIGFGIATLPRATLARLQRQAAIREWPCEVALDPLPIHASFRDDPSLHLIDAGLSSAPGFSQGPAHKRARAATKRPTKAAVKVRSSSKKSMTA
jgi:DNA-binding transcriptional LysR family regulator